MKNQKDSLVSKIINLETQIKSQSVKDEKCKAEDLLFSVGKIKEQASEYAEIVRLLKYVLFNDFYSSNFYFYMDLIKRQYVKIDKTKG